MQEIGTMSRSRSESRSAELEPNECSCFCLLQNIMLARMDRFIQPGAFPGFLLEARETSVP